MALAYDCPQKYGYKDRFFKVKHTLIIYVRLMMESYFTDPAFGNIKLIVCMVIILMLTLYLQQN